MIFIRNLGIFALMIFALYGALKNEKSGVRQLSSKFNLESLPDNSELMEFDSSGFGMDHYYLWKIRGYEGAELTVLNLLNVVKLGPTSSSGCLSIAEKKAQSWWPTRDFEDVLWGNNEPNYNLYTKELQHGAKVCVLNSLTDNTLYIQWFDV